MCSWREFVHASSPRSRSEQEAAAAVRTDVVEVLGAALTESAVVSALVSVSFAQVDQATLARVVRHRVLLNFTIVSTKIAHLQESIKSRS